MRKEKRKQIDFLQKTLVVRKGEYTISIDKDSSFYYAVYHKEEYKRVVSFWHRIPKELWLHNFPYLGRDLIWKYGLIFRSFLEKLHPETLLNEEEWQHLTLKEIFDSLDTVERLSGERD